LKNRCELHVELYWTNTSQNGDGLTTFQVHGKIPNKSKSVQQLRKWTTHTYRHRPPYYAFILCTSC